MYGLMRDQLSVVRNFAFWRSQQGKTKLPIVAEDHEGVGEKNQYIGRLFQKT